MRRYRKVQTTNKELTAVTCNRCGKVIRPRDGVWTEEFLHVDKVWGYFSEKDNRQDSFDLCESCYDALLAEFAVPVGASDDE